MQNKNYENSNTITIISGTNYKPIISIVIISSDGISIEDYDLLIYVLLQ